MADGIAAIAEAVGTGRVGAVEVAEATLERIAGDPLSCFTAVLRKRALADAAAVDRALAAGTPPGPLAGVPFAVKNLFDVAGTVTLAGSRINRDDAPAARDSFVVRRLAAAGAVLVGTLNMDEYAYGFTTENSHYGATGNARDPARMAGGSSGGSAAAVGAGLVPLSLGSDTNGSIRVPASLNGVYGLKPTYGRLGRSGCFPFVASLDHVGPFAHSAADIALAYDALQGPDPDDRVQAPRAHEPVSGELHRGIGGLRIARAGGYFAAGCEPEALAAVDAAAAALGVTDVQEIADAAVARAAAFVITAIEGAALHEANLRRRPDDFDVVVRDRLLSGLFLPGSWYVKAQAFRRDYRRAVLALFDRVDALLLPATPCSAPLIGQDTIMLAGVELPARPSLGLFTQPISFVGLPVLTVPVRRPAGTGGDLPLGLQVVAAPWREDVCFRIAGALEAAGAVEVVAAS